MRMSFEIIDPANFTPDHRVQFAEMLKRQGKVQGDFDEKLDRCKMICLAAIDDDLVGIGAIKVKTKSDFSDAKSGLGHLKDQFEWELGYVFTLKEVEGRGIASMIVKQLLREFGSGNLMASTELVANPGMVRILEKNGFIRLGNPWKSSIHENVLALFLRFKKYD